MEEQEQGRPSKEAQQHNPRSAMGDRSPVPAIFHSGTQVRIFRGQKSRSKARKQQPARNCVPDRSIQSSQAGIGRSIKKSRSRRETSNQGSRRSPRAQSMVTSSRVGSTFGRVG